MVVKVSGVTGPGSCRNAKERWSRSTFFSIPYVVFVTHYSVKTSTIHAGYSPHFPNGTFSFLSLQPWTRHKLHISTRVDVFLDTLHFGLAFSAT